MAPQQEYDQLTPRYAQFQMCRKPLPPLPDRSQAGECFQSWSALAEIRAALGPSWQHRQPDLQAEFSMDYAGVRPGGPNVCYGRLVGRRGIAAGI